MHGEFVTLFRSSALSNREKRIPMRTAKMQKNDGDSLECPDEAVGGKAHDVALARCLFADFDNIDAKDAVAIIKAKGLPDPTCTLASGHGLHAWWRLDKPMHDLKTWTQYQKQLIATLQSDKAIHDSPRIMRLPGFVNHKPPKADCGLLDSDSTRKYTLEEIGNSVAVAVKHYLQVTEDHFKQATNKATQNPTSKAHESSRNDSKTQMPSEAPESVSSSDCKRLRPSATFCNSSEIQSMGDTGLEPVTSSL